MGVLAQVEPPCEAAARGSDGLGRDDPPAFGMSSRGPRMTAGVGARCALARLPAMAGGARPLACAAKRSCCSATVRWASAARTLCLTGSLSIPTDVGDALRCGGMGDGAVLLLIRWASLWGIRRPEGGARGVR